MHKRNLNNIPQGQQGQAWTRTQRLEEDLKRKKIILKINYSNSLNYLKVEHY